MHEGVEARFVVVETGIEAGSQRLDARKKRASSFYDERRYEHPQP